jgi:hypothetical protein
MDAGTWASHWSSSVESLEPWAEYHEPAWLATRVVMLMLVTTRLKSNRSWLFEKLGGVLWRGEMMAG